MELEFRNMDFCGGRKTGRKPEKTPRSKRESTTKSPAGVSRRDLNPRRIGERRAFSLLHHPFASQCHISQASQGVGRVLFFSTYCWTNTAIAQNNARPRVFKEYVPFGYHGFPNALIDHVHQNLLNCDGKYDFARVLEAMFLVFL